VSIINRRNAVLGWLAWNGGKIILKQKAKAAVPSIDAETKKPNKTATALLLAGAVGALTFWRKRAADDDTPSAT
jgi:hypothetical protein